MTFDLGSFLDFIVQYGRVMPKPEKEFFSTDLNEWIFNLGNIPGNPALLSRFHEHIDAFLASHDLKPHSVIAAPGKDTKVAHRLQRYWNGQTGHSIPLAKLRPYDQREQHGSFEQIPIGDTLYLAVLPRDASGCLRDRDALRRFGCDPVGYMALINWRSPNSGKTFVQTLRGKGEPAFAMTNARALAGHARMTIMAGEHPQYEAPEDHISAFARMPSGMRRDILSDGSQ